MFSSYQELVRALRVRLHHSLPSGPCELTAGAVGKGKGMEEHEHQHENVAARQRSIGRTEELQIDKDLFCGSFLISYIKM